MLDRRTIILKVRIFPTEKQKRRIDYSLEAARFTWNKSLFYLINYFKLNGVLEDRVKYIMKFKYNKRDQIYGIGKVPKEVVENEIGHLYTVLARQIRYGNPVDIIKFRKKYSRKESYCIIKGKSLKFNNPGYIYIPRIKYVKYLYTGDRNLVDIITNPYNYELLQCKLIKDTMNEYYMQFLFFDNTSYPDPIPLTNDRISIYFGLDPLITICTKNGVDSAVRNPWMNPESTFYKNLKKISRIFKIIKKKIKESRKHMPSMFADSFKIYGSGKIRKLRKKLFKLLHKNYNIQNSYYDSICNKIYNKYRPAYVILGPIDILNEVVLKNLPKQDRILLSASSLRILRNKLKYKAFNNNMRVFYSYKSHKYYESTCMGCKAEREFTYSTMMKCNECNLNTLTSINAATLLYNTPYKNLGEY